MFGLGYGELLIIGIVAVILFGGRLPQVARSLGKSLTEFKKGMTDLHSEMNDVIHNEPSGEVSYECDDHGHYDDGQDDADSSFKPPTAPPRTEESAAEV